jgi:cytochrome c556
MKKTLMFAAALLTATPLVSNAQFAKPEDAIRYRQSALNVMGTHFGRLGPVVKGEKPYDAKEVVANVEIAEMMSKLPWVAFIPGTDKGNTKAKPEIWTDNEKFKTASENMQKAMETLLVAARAGNLDQVKAAFGDTGKACKACHDDFRAK